MRNGLRPNRCRTPIVPVRCNCRAFHVKRAWRIPSDSEVYVFHVKHAASDDRSFHVKQAGHSKEMFHVKQVDSNDRMFHVKQMNYGSCDDTILLDLCDIRVV